MLRHRVCFRVLTALLFIVISAATGFAEDYEIGQRGAVLRLGKGWTRSKIKAELGENQFSFDGGFFFVTETLSSLPPKYGARTMAEALLEGMKSGQTSDYEFISATEPTPYRWSEGFALAYDLIAKESSLDAFYRVIVVQKEDLVYSFIAWGLKANRAKVVRALGALPSALILPPEDSEWSRGRKEQRRTVVTTWGQVNASYAPGTWLDYDSEDAFFALTTPDDQMILEIYAGDEGSFDAHVEMLEDHLPSGEVMVRPLLSVELEWRGRRGRQLVAHTEDSSYTSLVVEISATESIEIRLTSDVEPSWVSSIFEGWLERIDVETIDLGLVFPTSAAESSPPDRSVASIDAWLSKSEWLGTAPGVRDGYARALGDGFATYGRGGVQAVPRADPPEWIFADGNRTFSANQLTVLGGHAYYRFGDYLYRLNESNEWIKTPYESLLEIELGGDPFFVLRPEEEFARGFDALGAYSREQLVRLVDGRRQVRSFDPKRSHLFLVANAAGTAAFIGRKPRYFDRYRRGAAPADCFAHAEDGSEVSLGSWYLIQVGPAADGWVVTGEPHEEGRASGCVGIYWVRPGEKPELLISGWGFNGVSMDEDTLTVAGSPYLPAQTHSSGTAIYRVPLEAVREFGPRSAPFSSGTMNALGLEGLESLGQTPPEAFATAESIRAFVLKCRERAKETVGRDLPLGKIEIDAAFSGWIKSPREFDSAGRALLTALITDAFLTGGAEWVTGRHSQFDLPTRERWVRSSCFSRADHPGRILESTLHDSDGYYEPISEVENGLNGRRLVLGLDPVAIEERMLQDPEAELWPLIEGEPGPLAAYLDQRRDNSYLRYEIYQRLVQTKRFDVMATIAEPYLDVQTPLFLDLRAWLSGHLQTDNVEDWDAFLDTARRAIEEYPRAPALYLLLGDAYRVRGEDHDDRRAKLCYEKVLELRDDGKLATEAKASIKEIEEAQ